MKRIALLLITVVVSIQCGKKKKHHSDPGPSYSPLELAFVNASRAHGIPVRYLMAVGYLESEFNPEASKAIYGDSKAIGPSLKDSAFGIARSELGLSSDSTPDLKIQIDSYANYVAKKMSGLEMQANPTTLNEKFNWLWVLADIQRGNQHSESDHPNIKALYVMELIQLLNHGFTFIDPFNQEVVQFAKESPAIDPNQLQDNDPNKTLLHLNANKSNSQLADLFIQIRLNQQEELVPTGILVNHCPLSLSACLRLQVNEVENDGNGMYLGTHYLIPQDSSLYAKPIQVSLETNPVPILNPAGDIQQSDKIIITLTGKSGFIGDSIRKSADPSWMSKWQLTQLGALIEDICARKSNVHDAIFDYKTCLTIGEGVHFQLTDQRQNHSYQWGDLVDYDAQIFAAHIKAYKGLPGDTQFDIATSTAFTAGQPIPLKVNFQKVAKHLILERLVRCNGHLKWQLVDTHRVASINQFQFETTALDQGPNQDGKQFFRVKVFGGLSGDNPNNRELLGWDTVAIFQKAYNKDETAFCYE